MISRIEYYVISHGFKHLKQLSDAPTVQGMFVTKEVTR